MAAAHLRVATLASPQLHPCGRRPAAKRMVACGAAGQSGFRWVSKRLAAQLVTQLVGEEETLDRLQTWLKEAGDSSSGSDSEGLFLELNYAARLPRSAQADLEYASDSDSSVREWLLPCALTQRDDARMASAFLYRLLLQFEQETGEVFAGYDRQYEQLEQMAAGLLGPTASLDRDLLRDAVEAYLAPIPGPSSR